jgi:glycosyltransferase involved in cell wall biosynthesis
MVSSGRIIHRVKGHDLAVRALAAALKDTPVDCEYCIAGTGPDEKALIELSQQLGIADKVRCLGWTEPADLRRLMCESHVLVHPSPIPDPFPNAVLEAMAAGMVVLGSDVCGSVKDRVEEGVSGFVHKAGDVDELAEHLRTVLRGRERLGAMGAAARRTAESWPVERGVAKIVDLYQGRFPPVN